jgi:MoaA/NifB/PqqE/SkfB family radical SAM enzyme
MILPLLKKINRFLPERFRLFAMPFYRALFPRVHNILFLPQLGCQYTCPYCIWTRFIPDDFKAAYHSASEWHGVFKKFPPSAITITGGEPLLYRDFASLVDSFPTRHMISSVVTNVGMGVERLASLKKKDFRVMVSFHPSMTDRETFAGRLRQLRLAGFRNVTINFVAYPAYLKQIPDLKNYFEQTTGFFFRVDTCKDPGISYTLDELDLIRTYKQRSIIAQDRVEGYDFSDVSLKTCKGGSSYLVIIANGNVYSCVEGVFYSVCAPYKDKKHPQDVFFLGNVFDGTFHRRLTDTVCHSPCSDVCDIEIAGVKKVRAGGRS